MEFLAQQYSDQVNMLHAAMRKLRDDVAEEHRARFVTLPHMMFFAQLCVSKIELFHGWETEEMVGFAVAQNAF